MKRPNLLFIGSLDVAPTFGGPIQFYRHFVERNDFVFQKIIEPQQSRLAHLFTGRAALDRLIDRLSYTRLYPHFSALNEWRAMKKAIPMLYRQAREARPDAIVTAAFGAYGFAAGEVAAKLKIPLVTFFHDWWPDLSARVQWSATYFDRLMQRLYRQSDLALCVCEQMREELGTHPNAPILYPICRAPMTNGGDSNAKAAQRPRVVYLGGMTRGYGRMMVALGKEYARRTERFWELAVFGEVKDWREEDVKALTDSDVYRGPRFGREAQHELEAADIYIVAMDFEAVTRRRVRTSFPSKLLDYCAFGKPVIVWAPEYSSVTPFARRNQFGLVHADSNASELVAKIDKLTQDQTAMSALADSSVRLSRSIFNPDTIHGNLVSAINDLLNQTRGADDQNVKPAQRFLVASASK